MHLPTINAIWIGPRLGPIHAACLRSFVRHGHKTILHAYERPEDLPDDVDLASAAELIPAPEVIGDYAKFADFLRYELLRRNAGLYVDCDVYCLSPMADADFIFGWERDGIINNAVLKLPWDSPALDDLCRLRDAETFIPPWAPPKRQHYYRALAQIGKPVTIQDMPWGYTGPRAVSHYLKKHGLEHHAQPIDVFYPVHYAQTRLFYDPALSVRDITTPRTKLLHLYTHGMSKSAVSEIPHSSPLGRIIRHDC